MAHLSLTFLGNFQVTLDGELLTAFRSSRVRGLLVYLLLTSQQTHSRDVLAALFWPDESDAVAKRNLRQSLYQLRKLLHDTDSSDPHLLVTRSTVQLNPASDHSLDVTAFLSYLENNQLDQAVTFYQGDLLPGFTCDSLPFDTWLREERECLHRLALDALYALGEQCLARGDYRDTQRLAKRQLALEPWREEAHRQLIQALALLGERSAALAQYATCQAVLAEELGAEPSADTKTLVARIHDQSQPQTAPSEPTSPFERRRLTIPFIGRRDEHDMLTRAYQQACQDGIRVIALLGEAGMGKTRLAEHFLDWVAMQGADILRGQAFETSGKLSYQPLTEALRQRLERENAPEDLLSDLWLSQLTRILPELRDRYPDLPAPTQEESTARQHLYEAITRLFQSLADRSPLIIFIDDCHWADAASMDVLHYAALRLLEERSPILVLLTLRKKVLTESSDLQTWLTRLTHNVNCKPLELTALSGAEAERLIHTLLAPMQESNRKPDNMEKPSQSTRFSRWLYEETEGQPFFLVETFKSMIEDGIVQPDMNSEAWRVDWIKFTDQVLESTSYVSTGVRDVILNWLGRMSEPARKLLTAAAVLGQQVAFDNLCHVAGIEETHAVTALDELLVRQLLLEVDEGLSGPSREPAYSFSHHMLREVVYNEAGAARRRLLHHRAFETLSATEASSADLAHHALHAGLVAETVQYSIVSGNEAMHLFAVHTAIAHYETAWQLAEQTGWPDAVSGADKQDLYTGLGRAYELTEAWPQAQQIYQILIADARTIEVPTMECLGLNRLAMVYLNGFHDTEQAIALLEEARMVAESSGDQRGLAETEWCLSAAARMDQRTYLARHYGEQALAIARELGHPQLLARCLNSLAYVHSRLRHWDRVKAYANEASDLYAASGNRILEADCQRLSAWSQIYAGRPRESLDTLRDTLAFSQQIENQWGEVECAWRLALTMLELGHYGEAIRFGRQAVKQARLVGHPMMMMMAYSTWGTVQRTIMALKPAEDILLEIRQESADKGLVGFDDWILGELCTARALAGDWEQAHDYAMRTLHAIKKEMLLPMSLSGWYWIEALLRGGDGDLARAEVDRLDQIVGNNRRYQLPLLRSQAVLAQWDGDKDQAIIHLQAATVLTQEIGLPGEEWSILAALGTLYADQGEQNEAQRAWKLSADIIVRLAETIDEEDVRVGFLETEVVRHILARSV